MSIKETGSSDSVSYLSKWQTRVISEKTYAEQSSIRSVSNFFTKYQLGAALKRSGAYKSKGVPVSIIIKYLISLVYTGKSMYQDIRGASPLASSFAKDTVYRLLNSMFVNWQAFLLIVSSKVVADIDKLTSAERLSAFVIDDTMFWLPYAKMAELSSLIHDHAEKGKNKFKWGFRLLTIGWTDGVSFIPLAFRHLASADEKKQRRGARACLDKRSRAYNIRKEAVSKATGVLLLKLNAAVKAGIAAKYVLFDTWFAYPVTIIKVHALGLHTCARVKDTTTIMYLWGGARKTARQIFKENKKRRGKSRYLLSVEIFLLNSEDKKATPLPARLVYVRNRQKRNKWIALICTDLSLSEEEIISLYGKRWDIEVFFKICKSYLKLTGEFHQLSYDAITAHTAIVMIRYMILSAAKRTREDPRSLGDLCYSAYDEVADIRFEQALILLMDLLADTLKESDLGLSEEQMTKIMDRFIEKLPLSFKVCLQPDFIAAR